MKKIKFRAFIEPINPSEKSFIANIDYFTPCCSDPERVFIDGKKYKDDMYKITLMQYIGLNDTSKKRIEIYEGDIVKAINKSHDRTLPDEWIGEVKYGLNNCCFGLRNNIDISIAQDCSAIQPLTLPIFNFINFHCGIVPDMDLKIIGNIYENPELLTSIKVKEK